MLQAALPPGLSLSLPVPLPLPNFHLVLCVLFSLLEAFIYLAAELVPLKTAACVTLSTPHGQCSVLQMMRKTWATALTCLVLTTEWSRSIHLGVSPPPSKIRQNKHPAGPLHLHASLGFCFCFVTVFSKSPQKGALQQAPGSHHYIQNPSLCQAAYYWSSSLTTAPKK